MKGQKDIRLIAPDTIDDAGTVRSIKPDSVFDVTQTQKFPNGPPPDMPCPLSDPALS